MYQVINWEDYFEGAKSKTYNNKTTCQMPTKHGLGYRRLVKQKNGAALFGAWCAMIQLLSRQEKPRQGYLTDTGREDGIPLLPEDLELLCDIPENVFKQMLQVCASERVGWLKDTTGIPQESEVSSQCPLNLDLDLDLNSDSDIKEKHKKEIIYRAFDHLSLTIEEFERMIKDGFTKEEIDCVCDDIENYKQNTKYKSLNLTARKWINNNRKKKQDEIEAKEREEDEFVENYFKDGFV